jgi:glycine/D-amino acid oxidase-like deaminating enzyme
MRVVVIGGGFAGLIAADRIARSGQQFVVRDPRAAEEVLASTA